MHCVLSEQAASLRCHVLLLFVCAQGSDADNIIPDEVILRGTLRALTHEHMMFIKQRIEQVSRQTPTAFKNFCVSIWCH
jgi:IAA-amino acid hydrolase